MKKRTSTILLVLALSLAMLCGCKANKNNVPETGAADASGNVDTTEAAGTDTENATSDGTQTDASTSDASTTDVSATDASANGKEQTSLIKPKDKSEYNEYNNVITVDSAEALLDAIASDTTIVVKGGYYNLTEIAEERYSEAEAEEYAGVMYTHCFDGVMVKLFDVSNLTIKGAEGEEVELVVEPRYAEVLNFENCTNIKLENMTMGHTGERGSCAGDVLEFSGCYKISLHNLDLYGCGTYGISLYDSANVKVEDSIIRECSYGIVEIRRSSNVTFAGCTMRDCDGYTLLDCVESDIVFSKCNFSGSRGAWGFLPGDNNENDILFTQCDFGYDETESIYDSGMDRKGISFKACKFAYDKYQADCDFEEVSSVEELLEAIAPNRSISVLKGKYNLSEFIEDKDIDKWNKSHKYVKLEEVFDGISIRIENVDTLYIFGDYENADTVEIVTEPRYADVFAFSNCKNINLNTMTMGHTDTGDCVGNVLTFLDCENINLSNMDLYGCGVYGIWSENTKDLYVSDSTVRECSAGPVCITGSEGKNRFSGCTFIGSDGGFDLDSELDIEFNECSFGGYEEDSLRYRGDINLSSCTFMR